MHFLKIYLYFFQKIAPNSKFEKKIEQNKIKADFICRGWFKTCEGRFFLILCRYKYFKSFDLLNSVWRISKFIYIFSKDLKEIYFINFNKQIRKFNKNKR